MVSAATEYIGALVNHTRVAAFPVFEFVQGHYIRSIGRVQLRHSLAKTHSLAPSRSEHRDLGYR